MTKDDISLALRMLAMGRPSHPATEALVDALSALLADEPAPAEPPPAEAKKKK